MKLFIMYFSPLPCYLVPLRPKYSPQHPILEHPQPKFFPPCGRPRFMAILNKYIVVLYVLKFNCLDS